MNSLLHSPFAPFFHSFTRSSISSRPSRCTGSLGPPWPAHTSSSLVPSTASYQEAEPVSRLGPLVLTSRTFSSILTSSLLNCAGKSPVVQSICFPLSNRCSCNYCFDFHPLMPENSFHKLLQHAMRQARSLCRVWRAWGFSCQDTADSWQSELQGTWGASLLGPGISWRGRQAWSVVGFLSWVKKHERRWPISGLWSHDPSELRLLQ